VSAPGARLDAGDIAAVDAALAALASCLAGAGPAARAELRACLHRVITGPWPEDMYVAAMLCRLALRDGATTGGNQ
jgi:hypothetical protein